MSAKENGTWFAETIRASGNYPAINRPDTRPYQTKACRKRQKALATQEPSTQDIRFWLIDNERDVRTPRFTLIVTTTASVCWKRKRKYGRISEASGPILRVYMEYVTLGATAALRRASTSWSQSSRFFNSPSSSAWVVSLGLIVSGEVC